ncbi:MAG TPA: ATP-binding protein [Candidatus Polarisedimenticolia bacterium]
MTLAVLLMAHYFSLVPPRVPNPSAIYILAVIFAAFVGGVVPGLVSAGMTLAWAALIYQEPGSFLHFSEENQSRMLLLALTTPSAALLVGVLRTRLEREVQGRTAARAMDHAQDLLQSLDAIVWEADALTWRINFVSRRAEAILGYPVQAWLDDPDFWVKHIHPEDRERCEAFCREATARRADHELEYRFRAADGRIVWLRDVVRVITDAEGHPRRLCGVMVDVTRSRQAQDVARRIESELHAVFDAALDAIFILDDNRTFIDVNPAGCAMLGLTRDGILGRPMSDFVATAGASDDLWRHFLKRGSMIGQMTLRLEDGTRKEVEYAARANFSPGCHVSILRDLTPRKKLEEQLLQSQKLEAIGRVAGHVAHDFKNLLTVIRGYCEVLQDRLGPDHSAREEIGEVLRAAGRASDLIHRLLVFSRRQAIEPKPVDLNAELASMERVLRQVLGERNRLVALPGSALPSVHADPEGLHQLVMNLVTNARDAMPDGGTLTIETASIEDPPASPGTWVSLVVRDTGHGMDPRTRAHIFEPFFTTKGAAGGTGLGLSSAYGFVTQIGGKIQVDSEPGRGSTFSVLLRPAGRAAEMAGRAMPEPARAATFTILVVDDEPVILDLATRSLEPHGYHVLRASHPDEALRLGTQHDGPIHLLLTDIVLPRMNGRELAAALARQRSETKIMFMSGVEREAVLPADLPVRGLRFLPKPFTPDDLVQSVREILEAA